ncbi:MAG TPA: hypothetical protein VK550_30670 [Polyangiaceae bacterium]|nr:hypothetical protein [Polyangiaceae bacterium]
MKLDKLTTLLVVDRIESSVSTWEALGYKVVARVPEQGTADFAMLQGNAGELMMQTRKSLGSDLPGVAERKTAFLLYADVASLAEAKKAIPQAKVIVSERTTFYGAKEAWVELENGVVLGLAQHDK